MPADFLIFCHRVTATRVSSSLIALIAYEWAWARLSPRTALYYLRFHTRAKSVFETPYVQIYHLLIILESHALQRVDDYSQAVIKFSQPSGSVEVHGQGNRATESSDACLPAWPVMLLHTYRLWLPLK